jgi:hypothetical protein
MTGSIAPTLVAEGIAENPRVTTQIEEEKKEQKQKQMQKPKEREEQERRKVADSQGG